MWKKRETDELRKAFEFKYTRDGNPKNKVRCKKCGDIIIWDQAYLDETGKNSPCLICCICGETAVDPTPYMTRFIGNALEELAVGSNIMLKDAVLETEFEAVWGTLKKYYTDWDKYNEFKDVDLNKARTDYKSLFDRLENMQAVKGDGDDEYIISVFWRTSSEDDEEYYVAYALKENEDEETRYGLEATAWDEWLGMRIEMKALRRYSLADIVAACLFEMTFFGINEERWKKNIKEFETRNKK